MKVTKTSQPLISEVDSMINPSPQSRLEAEMRKKSDDELVDIFIQNIHNIRDGKIKYEDATKITSAFAKVCNERMSALEESLRKVKPYKT